MLDPKRARELLTRYKIQKLRAFYRAQLERMRLEFPEQRRAWADQSRLTTVLCGRRSGKTKGGCEEMVLEAATTPGGRFLYLNSTRDECERLAWVGLKQDGMESLTQRLVNPDGSRLRVHANQQKLTLHFPDFGSWIYLRGADDEAEVRKALGLAYHKVWWDEAQKIPSKLSKTVQEVMMPTLLDFGGRFTLSGSPVRNMSGLFYDTSRPDSRRLTEWALHEWCLLDNPFFGATREERMRNGMLDLQKLLGGPNVAPLDGPIMRREGWGKWTYEDAAFVYDVHKIDAKRLVYAPARKLANGFPDFAAALEDLPGWGEVDYFTGIGADIGYSPDPFAICGIAWNLRDPNVYELGSWSSTKLDSDEQAKIIRAVRDIIRPCVAVADAGGSARPTIAGWEKEWVARYGIPIVPAQKSHKHGAIARYNADIVNERWRFREGSTLLDELGQVQWATVRSAGGRLVEDPTIPNDEADASLYAHRGAYHFRYREEEDAPEPGTAAWDQREEEQLLRQLEESHRYDYEQIM